VLVDSDPDIARRWRVTSWPTTVITRNGREVDRLAGAVPYEKLISRLREATQTPLPNRQEIPSLSPIVRGQSPTASPSQAISPAHTQSMSLTPSTATASDPQGATVRIRIEDANSIAFGTGTIIDQHGDEALILTCGHLFRDWNAHTNLTIECFVGGMSKSLSGSVVDYKMDGTDIGLISFRPGRPVPTARLLPRGESVRESQNVFSYGCDLGAEPSRRDSRITKLNRYLGPANVEVAGAPVQGRSGGGLFNDRGELVGVCYAADKEYDEGLYSGPDVVYEQLSKLKLTHLYEQKNSGPALTGLGPAVITGDNRLASAASDANLHNIRGNDEAVRNRSSGQEIYLVVRQSGQTDQVIPIPNPTPAISALIQQSVRR
jgi:hypothetical protein